jgi:serine/threonine protein phosphatase PrpC
MTPNTESAVCTHVGMKRKTNQDLAGAFPDQGLFILADGMGGHQGGETASRVCVETIHNVLQKNANIPQPQALRDSVQQANLAIFEQSKSEPTLKGMGTTVTALQLVGTHTAHLAQVGDSRAYYWNSKGIWQLTEDHSHTFEKWRAGLISHEQIKFDEMKNVITRSVGYEPTIKVDLFSFPLATGDGFLLCSDGLSNPLSDALMFDILDESTKAGLSLQDMAKELVQAANERGGDDNVTVILVRIK